ncbi:hypothetical protein C8J56DRAFT_1097084 [Mycena floridula]|nr:hypothetical protein C8J56DRAFT_1097084 [Mycena floridula]
MALTFYVLKIFKNRQDKCKKGDVGVTVQTTPDVRVIATSINFILMARGVPKGITQTDGNETITLLYPPWTTVLVSFSNCPCQVSLSLHDPLAQLLDFKVKSHQHYLIADGNSGASEVAPVPILSLSRPSESSETVFQRSLPCRLSATSLDEYVFYGSSRGARRRQEKILTSVTIYDIFRPNLRVETKRAVGLRGFRRPYPWWGVPGPIQVLEHSISVTLKLTLNGIQDPAGSRE